MGACLCRWSATLPDAEVRARLLRPGMVLFAGDELGPWCARARGGEVGLVVSRRPERYPGHLVVDPDHPCLGWTMFLERSPPCRFRVPNGLAVDEVGGASRHELERELRPLVTAEPARLVASYLEFGLLGRAVPGSRAETYCTKLEVPDWVLVEDAFPRFGAELGLVLPLLSRSTFLVGVPRADAAPWQLRMACHTWLLQDKSRIGAAAWDDLPAAARRRARRAGPDQPVIVQSPARIQSCCC